ncbi:ERBB-3 binding protein 1, partial [Tanacetum coccineum]
ALRQTGSMYKNVKKKIDRGVAFPTCFILIHIDGFIAVVAHTHVLHEGPMTGRAAVVIAAANTAAEVALRIVRPGKRVYYLFCFRICFCLLIVLNIFN